MKKLITTAIFALAACTFGVAQDAGFKPEKGGNTYELNFVPLNGKPIQLTYIRYRRFISESMAFRLGVGVSYSSSKADSVFTSPLTPANKITGKYKKSTMGWEIKPGIEKHMKGTDRLSPYCGVELDFAGASSKEITPTGTDATGKTEELVIMTEKNKSKGGFFRVGANLVAGFDCYITHHLYLGSEFGFGFQMVNYTKYTKTTSYPSSYPPIPSGTVDPGNPDPTTQGKEVNVGPNFNSSIRLGWVF